MNKNLFWELIEKSNEQAEGDVDYAMDLLRNSLEELEAESILKFHNIFQEYHNISNKNKLWAAAYVINGGCSDDGFDYFRGWLIAQGKSVFMKALEKLDEIEDAECEYIMSVAGSAYLEKFSDGSAGWDKFYSGIKLNPLTQSEIDSIHSEIVYGDDMDIEWEEEDLAEIAPELYERYGF